MFNNLKDYSVHLWFETLKIINNKETISFDNLLLLRNIAVWLKDKEKIDCSFVFNIQQSMSLYKSVYRLRLFLKIRKMTSCNI